MPLNVLIFSIFLLWGQICPPLQWKTAMYQWVRRYRRCVVNSDHTVPLRIIIFICKKKVKKNLQVQKKCVYLHPRLRKTPQDWIIGAVVQLVRISACHAGGRGFESRPHRKREHSSVGLEHLPYKQRVGGSTPSAPTRKEIRFTDLFFRLYILDNITDRTAFRGSLNILK